MASEQGLDAGGARCSCGIPRAAAEGGRKVQAADQRIEEVKWKLQGRRTVVVRGERRSQREGVANRQEGILGALTAATSYTATRK